MGHKEESYYKKRLGGIKKGCKRQLRATMDKIEIRNPKISLINCIGIPPNDPSKNMLAISDAGANIHPEKQFTTTMNPVKIQNDSIEILPYGSTME